ncbi:hypothetical protein PG993_013755 [Apiospora rasikravindrae]|uniref:Zn(2)-C6 fungal-type domain-containing protein n=1 Tax=Apiospora rasikravindrae TaxID=990691 RepID=A0ABR1RR28_9PEZI
MIGSSHGDHRLLQVRPAPPRKRTQERNRESAGPPTSRSRNGCVTCKKRHVRCDERKPACFRCEKAGAICQGYSSKAELSARAARQTAARPILPAAQHRREPTPALLASPSACPFQGVEVTYFDVFRHEVVYDILSTGYKDFWNRALVRNGLEIDYIRHSILALGALSLSVNENANNQAYPTRDWNSTPSPGLHYNAALHHHVKALALFGRSLSSRKRNAVHPRVIILVTILFVAFEYLHGNNSAAIGLINSGFLLLAQRSPEIEAGSPLTDVVSGDFEGADIIEDAPGTFARFGIVGLLTPFVPLETRIAAFGGGNFRSKMPDINTDPETLFSLWRDFVFALTKFSADIEFVSLHPEKGSEHLPKAREPIKSEDIPQRLADEMREISLWKKVLGHHCRTQTDPVVSRWLHIAKVQLLGIECITQDVTGVGGAPDYFCFLDECEALQRDFPPDLQSRLTYDGIINILMNAVFWSKDRGVCRRALETAQRYTVAHMDRERVGWIRRSLRQLVERPEAWMPRSDWIGAGVSEPGRAAEDGGGVLVDQDYE